MDVAKLLPGGEVAIQDMVIGTQVVDVDMSRTGQKKQLLRLILLLRSMDVGWNLLTELQSCSGVVLAR